jgi:hypothetical protein
LALDRAALRGDECKEAVAPDLDCDVGGGEEQRLVAERLRDRDRHQEAGQHQRDQQQTDDDRAGIELVGDPGRVVPRPPDDEQHERRLSGPLPRQVLEQQVRYLRDRKDEDEVVEELERGHALLDPGIAVERGSRHPCHAASRPRP